MNSIVKKQERNRALNTHWVRNADAADTVPRDESATRPAELACNE
jgi:hypothetical protein